MEGKSPAQGGRLGWFPILACLAFCLAFLPGAGAQTAPDSCLACHSRLDPPLEVNPEAFAKGIHAQNGLTCVSCHGGDATSSDMARAMSPAAGFKGHIGRKQIPALCASCHSNATYMRRFNPSLRTDQFSQYQTSVHGQLLAKGDAKVAVCTDCHGLHDIRAPTDPRSSVYPLNVAKTCAACHADAAYMKPYKIPTNQYAAYTASVHYEDLTVGSDLSAPTCVTCHGSHGAVPPGVTSVVNVCSTCHVFQARLFDRSPHKQAFATMGLPGCVVCHSNHRIVEPTDAFVGTGKGAVCVNCHTRGDTGYVAAARIHRSLGELQASIRRSNGILTRAEASGMEVGQAKLELADAQDDLTKARVAVHNFNPVPVDKDVQAGLVITQKTYQAGVAALAERDYRRKGLGISLIVILGVVIGFWLLIRKVESRGQQEAKK
ncbi:MAG TPA: cytochrome c3 family protein [Patescibacteria group bacterium]|nr:cytochrome c3 family protein [Patescibacteria group bacterium]